MRTMSLAGTVTVVTISSAIGSPKRAVFFHTVTSTGASFSFATPIANCWAAASLDTPNSVSNASLSRSTAQNSQPTFDGSLAAFSHAVTQAPYEQARSAGQSSTNLPPVPSALHSHTSLSSGPPQ
jgi:hypothetical protein